MSTETDRLAQEADQQRSHLDATLDELRGKLSVGQIVDELSSYVRKGQGADMVHNFGRQVRDNPLALGLVGAGIAWLFAGSGVRAEGDRLRHEWEDRRYDRFGEAFPPHRDGDDHHLAEGRAQPVRDYGPAGVYRTEAGSASPTGSSAGSSLSGAGSRASDAASSARHGASSAASSVGSAASNAGHSAADAASRASHSASDAAGRAGHAASSAAGAAADSMRRASHDASDAAWRGGRYAADGMRHAGEDVYRMGRRTGRGLIDALQEEPLVFGAIAVAVGAAIGAALPSTRREDEWMGETRDRLRDEAFERGRDTLHRAEHVAERAYQAGSEEADAKGLKPKPGEGETLAEKVGDVGRAASDAAKSEAKKEGLT
ncbi:DUF3618 domain-containing protein [Aurantimonas sp. VKM B-3413]|uniref:DUF3618 domain-containing protein n=1 Tax=Aurantimonas sp. VKM B-3413 TaxID=2779401 RepID=UPI001E2B941D|nr:DUF3618 domain-containing protein [Aurantimonas sp. VKM B-3413]MCB8840076.1 DUF3618 domain-containing protein [Aurantimonas sp. VKM B-3413]